MVLDQGWGFHMETNSVEKTGEKSQLENFRPQRATLLHCHLCKRVSILLQAHKALLATQSDYFRVMFTADMRERDQDKIHMKGLTAAGFGHILRFMYYGSLELSMPTVQEILQVMLHTH